MGWRDIALGIKSSLFPDYDLFKSTDVAQAWTGKKASDVYGIPTGQPDQRLYTKQRDVKQMKTPSLWVPQSQRGTGFTGEVVTGDGDTGDINPFAGVEATGTSPSEIDDIYNSLMNYYSGAKETLAAGQPSRYATLKAARTAALLPIEEGETRQTEQIAGQRGEAQQGGMDALSQVRRAFSELSAGSLARFGTGTSAGPASQEILGRETMRAIGASERLTTSRLAKLDTDLRLVTEFTARSKSALEEKYEAQKLTLEQSFRTELSEIDRQIALTESAKAAAKVDVLNTLRQNQWNLDLAKKQFESDLALFDKELRSQATAVVADFPQFDEKLQSSFMGEQAGAEPRYVASMTPETWMASRPTARGSLAGVRAAEPRSYSDSLWRAEDQEEKDRLKALLEANPLLA